MDPACKLIDFELKRKSSDPCLLKEGAFGGVGAPPSTVQEMVDPQLWPPK